MSRRSYWGVVFCLLVGAQSAGAQEQSATADDVPAHDWEFVLSATDRAPGAAATVMVTEAEGGSNVRVEVTGLPLVDSLDEEGRDVGAYTVWVVPSREQVRESTLAGVLSVDESGYGQFDLVTGLDTFGIIVTATVDGAPERIGGVPVLTGIPVTTSPPVDEEGAEDAAPPPDADPADEATTTE